MSTSPGRSVSIGYASRKWRTASAIELRTTGEVIPSRAARDAWTGILRPERRLRGQTTVQAPEGAKRRPAMQRRSFRTLLALGLVATLAASSLAWAEAQGGDPAGSHRSKRFQETLGLTDEQMAQIRDVHARHAPEFRQLGQSLRQARTELKQAALTGGDVKGKAAAFTALLGQMTEL